jgi:hypothetical protein
MSALDRARKIYRRAAGHAHAGGRPAWRQFLEMAALFALRRHGPDFYEEARFWERSVEWRHMLAQPSAAAYRAQIARLNPPEYQKVFQYKLYEKAVLAQLGIPTAPFIGYLHKDRGFDSAGTRLTSADDLERLLRNLDLERVCFKELEGWGGRGFKAVSVDRRDDVVSLLPLDGGQPMKTADYCAQALQLDSGNEWLLEGYLKQHPEFAAFNPTSVNTLRILVAKRSDGSTFTIGAYLRFGGSGALVDNVGGGGFVAHIRVPDGVFEEVLWPYHGSDTYKTHPIAGFPITGVHCFGWDQIRGLAEESLRRIPTLRFAGMDVALTSTGPCLVEINPWPDRQGLVRTRPRLDENVLTAI